jgi:hypothetical protein
MRACSLLLLLLLPAAAAACESGAPLAQHRIVDDHVPSCLSIVRDDVARTRRGLTTAAERFAGGFVVANEATREQQMRTALRRVQDPAARSLAIPEFVTTPASFLAAVGADGHVIARDTRREDDHMMGEPFGERYPVIARALSEARAGYELGEFPALEGESSWSVLFAHPSRREGRTVGVMIAGIPLWRLAQRLSRQLALDNASEQGAILWVWIYKGDRVFAPQPGLDLEQLVPGPAAREQGFATSPRGYTGEVQQFGRWYAYGVVPLPILGEDVGMVVFRSDPT